MNVLVRAAGLARRSGLLDPRRSASLGISASVWGPTTATAYAAAALQHPLRTAVIDDFGSLTYFQLEHRSSRVAAGLKHLGVDRGDSVGLLCRNHRGFIEANVALAKLGARVVYLNPGLPPEQLVALIERENMSMVILDRDLVGQLAHADPSLERVVASAGDASGWSFPGLRRWRPLLQLPRPLAKDDPVVLTSGTTGTPKGTVRNAGVGVLAATLSMLESIPYRHGDVMVLSAPLFHAWGLSQLILSAGLAQTVVLRQTFDAETTLNDVEAHGADLLVAVPVMLQRMLQVDHAVDVSTLRVTAISGSALPGDLAVRWMDRYGANLYSLYGSTEVGQVSVATPDQLAGDPSSAGSALRGVSMRILDPEGNDVAIGEIGRIMVGSASRFDGYTDGGNKEMIDDYMSIGDLGWLGPHGELHVTGRSDDMIISGGENVYPSTVERALLGIDLVVDVAVVGVPDADLGQKVRAVVVLDHAVTHQSATAVLKEALRASLAPHEVPREFVYVEELPRNGAGKIIRRHLTEPRQTASSAPKKSKK